MSEEKNLLLTPNELEDFKTGNLSIWINNKLSNDAHILALGLRWFPTNGNLRKLTVLSNNPFVDQKGDFQSLKDWEECNTCRYILESNFILNRAYDEIMKNVCNGPIKFSEIKKALQIGLLNIRVSNKEKIRQILKANGFVTNGCYNDGCDQYSAIDGFILRDCNTTRTIYENEIDFSEAIKSLKKLGTYKETEELTSKEKETTMSQTIKETAKDLLELNKQAAFNVGKITLGKTATTKLAKIIKPKLPMMIRGYADSPIFKIALANMIGLAIKQYSSNKKALYVAEAIIEASMFQLAESFNIQEMIDSFLDGITLPETEELNKELEVKPKSKK